MKTRQFIFGRFVSFKTKPPFGLRQGLKDPHKHKHLASNRGDGAACKNSETSTNETAPVKPKLHGESKRLVFISPLPGRWIRCAAVMLVGAAALVAQRASAVTEPTFQSANHAFSEGNYAEAIRSYEAVIAQQGYSAAVLFNLANAQVKSGQVGRAILNYERALALSPNDAATMANLQWARHKAGLTAPLPRWYDRAVRALSLNGWSVVASGALLGFCALMVLNRLWARYALVMRSAKLAAAVVLVAALSALGSRWSDLNAGIVVAKDATARLSPVTIGAPMFDLAEGQTVHVMKSYGTFVLVNSDGRQGWVKGDAIARVLDSPAAFQRGHHCRN